MRRLSNLYMLSIAGLCLAIAGCGGQPIHVSRDGPPIAGPVALDRVSDAYVKDERVGRAGNPESYVVFGRRYHVMKTSQGFKERGYASWYGKKFHGRKTSNGEIYNMYGMTAAHKTLPIPSYVRVKNLENGREAIVRVNDRGPFHSNRIIDLSYTAAFKLGVLKKGTAKVEIEVVTKETLAAEKRAREAPPVEPKQTIQAVQTQPISAPVPIAVKAVYNPSAPEANTSNPAAASMPTAAQAPASGYGHFLQAGAFRFQDNAKLLEGRLRQAGLGSAGIETLRSGDIYRVRLGPYTDQAQLQHDHERLRALGIKPQTLKPQSQ